MTNGTKKHAKDYLEEFINSNSVENWLNLLIKKVIEYNGKLSEEDKEELFNQLLSEGGLELKNLSKGNESAQTIQKNELPKKEKEETFVLKQIMHKNGVNALMQDQSMVFRKNCTIIFGLNATGKSGYFRIIHELAGGSKPKNVLGNIYNQLTLTQNNKIEVDISYILGTDEKTYCWNDKNMRSISPFTRIRVFDSTYLPIFLNERDSSVNVEPLGLHLFEIITKIIDEFKDRINVLKNEETSSKPNLQHIINQIHSENIKNTLRDDKPENIQRLISCDEYQEFSKEQSKTLDNLKNEKQLLETQNIQDTKKVLSHEKEILEKFKNYLNRVKSEIEGFTKCSSYVLKEYNDKKNIRNARKKEFEVLKNIPLQDTAEWQSFIESANAYKDKINDEKKECIYCRQPLNAEALNLVQTYFTYLNDKSTANFKKAEGELRSLLKKVKGMNVEFTLFDNLNHVFEQQMRNTITNIISSVSAQKSTLINYLENTNDIVPNDYILDLSNIIKTTSLLLEEKNKKIESLDKNELDKKQKIAQFEKKIYELEDKKTICINRIEIEKYFDSLKKTQEYDNLRKSLNTRKITNLAETAHDELLTENITNRFQEELEKLGQNIDVKLEKTGAGKGKVRTRLKILQNNVQDILSEGEQKTIGLALFLAEINNQDDTSPVVFDDPVTSLDHEIADLLAKRLLELSLKRQIIIFTHNKLFYDSLVSWVSQMKGNDGKRLFHCCENYGLKGCASTKGDHIYVYKLEREKPGQVGRIFGYEAQSLQYYLEKVKKELKNHSYDVVDIAGKLKRAIEHYIDEKILMNQGLLKDRKSRSSNIEWDMLKKINGNPEIINKLHEYWNKLSNRGIHLTENSSVNPLQLDEINKIVDFLQN